MSTPTTPDPNSALRISNVRLWPASLAGPATVRGTVTLNGAAAASAATIQLTSSDPAVTVPSTVAVPPGATTATFDAAVTPVASNRAVTIRASVSGVVFPRNLQLWGLLPNFHATSALRRNRPDVDEFVLATPPTTTLSASCGQHTIHVSTRGLYPHDADFMGPDGRPLTKGTYDIPAPTSNNPPRTDGPADFYSITCRGAGRMVIHDISVTDARVQRLWASVDLLCLGDVKFFAEYRITDPPPAPAFLLLLPPPCTPTP